MATFKVRVEQLSGTTPDDGVLSDWLTAGARVLSNLIPLSDLDRYIQSVAISEAGTSITDGILYDVTKNGYKARKVFQDQAFGIERRDSLYYPSERTPVYLLTGSTLKVFPDGGQAWMLPLYSVLHSDSTIQRFPNELEHGVVLFASMSNKTYQMQNLIGSIAITYSDASAAAIAATTIENFPAAPVFTKTNTPPSYTDFVAKSGSEDVELGQLYLQRVDRDQQDWGIRVNEELQEFNAEYQVFRENTNKILEQARLTQQRLIEAAAQSTDVSKTNKINALSALVQEYQTKLGRLSAMQSEMGVLLAQYRDVVDKYMFKKHGAINTVQQ